MKFIKVKDHIVNVERLLSCNLGHNGDKYAIWFTFDTNQGSNHFQFQESIIYPTKEEAEKDFADLAEKMKSLLCSNYVE